MLHKSFTALFEFNSITVTPNLQEHVLITGLRVKEHFLKLETPLRNVLKHEKLTLKVLKIEIISWYNGNILANMIDNLETIC